MFGTATLHALMHKRATIKDIAHALNISVSTVSRGLKDHPDISVDLCVLIKAKAKELNYHPNHLASGLRKRRSRFIGLIIPEITMFFFPSVIKGMEEEARANGFQLLVLQSNDNFETEKANVQLCMDHSIDGLLISLSNQTNTLEHLLELQEQGIPVVIFDKSIDQSPFDEVVIADEEVARKATEELINAGGKDVVGVFGSERLSISRQRARGFISALKTAGLPAGDDRIYFAADYASGKETIAQLLHHKNPDALFLMSDELLAAASHVLQKRFGNEPEKCKLAAISDGLLPEMLLYPSIIFKHDGKELGLQAARRLFHRIFTLNEGAIDEPPRRVLIDVPMLITPSMSREYS